MFRLVGIEVSLRLQGNGDGILAFIVFRHDGYCSIAGLGSGQVFVGNYLLVCAKKHEVNIGGGI